MDIVSEIELEIVALSPIGILFSDFWIGNNTLNDSAEESSHPNRMVVTPNGFMLNINDGRTNASGGTYIYVAIRRGQMRTPATGLEVFDVTETGTDNSLFTTDLHTIDVNFQHQKVEY